MEKRSWNQIKKEELSEEINRQMIWGKNLMAVRFELAPNSSISMHEHESEQLTLVQNGLITIQFSEHQEVTLGPNDMTIIPPMVQHSASAGPEGCVVIDLFSPIRQDFVDGSAEYFKKSKKTAVDGLAESKRSDDFLMKEPYSELHGFLAGVGVRVPIEKLREHPVEIVARYAYEKECVTMGQLREILGIDKKQAKDMLRAWKHGDDHSESSYRRSLERIVIVPNIFKQETDTTTSKSAISKEENGRKKNTED